MSTSPIPPMLAPLPYAGSALSRSVMIKTKKSPSPPSSGNKNLKTKLNALVKSWWRKNVSLSFDSSFTVSAVSQPQKAKIDP